jgi:hypothetical protein
MSKLVKESLEEAMGNPWIEQFFEEYPEAKADFEEEGSVGAYDLASFVDDVWGELTGRTNKEKDAEDYFPGSVDELVDLLGVDLDDFSQAWGSVREGADDWEPEYCTECGEEIEDYRVWDGYDICQECEDKENEEEDED